jgi:hypothetical protein
MTDPSLELKCLSARISSLERANRRWKVGALLLFVTLVVAALLTGFNGYAQLKSPAVPQLVPDTVAAHEFFLIGARGEIRGRIGMVDGKPSLQFYDNTGKLWWYAPPKMGVVPVHVK